MTKKLEDRDERIEKTVFVLNIPYYGFVIKISHFYLKRPLMKPEFFIWVNKNRTSCSITWSIEINYS